MPTASRNSNSAFTRSAAHATLSPKVGAAASLAGAQSTRPVAEARRRASASEAEAPSVSASAAEQAAGAGADEAPPAGEGRASRTTPSAGKRWAQRLNLLKSPPHRRKSFSRTLMVSWQQSHGLYGRCSSEMDTTSGVSKYPPLAAAPLRSLVPGRQRMPPLPEGVLSQVGSGTNAAV